ncbi:hypothetical protein KUCAC02_012306, partial [Chaenocephalus aceratus]
PLQSGMFTLLQPGLCLDQYHSSLSGPVPQLSVWTSTTALCLDQVMKKKEEEASLHHGCSCVLQ